MNAQTNSRQDPRFNPYIGAANIDRVQAVRTHRNRAFSDRSLSRGLSVIILNLDRPDLIIPLIDRLEAMEGKFHESGLKLQLIIADTGSTHPAVLKRLDRAEPPTSVLRDQVYHFSALNNAAFEAHAATDVSLFLNNDVILDEKADWPLRIREVFDSNTSIGAAGMALWYPDKRLQHAGVDFLWTGPWAGLPYHPGAGSTVRPEELLDVFEVPAVTGAALAIRSDLFMRLGGFDEQYASEAQDVDLCMRVQRAGYVVAALSSPHFVYHLENATRPQGDENWDDRRLFRRRWESFARATWAR